MELEKQKHGGALARHAKGSTGNPKGKPKGAKSFKKILKDFLSNEITLENAMHLGKITKKQAMMFLLVQTAIDEDEDPNIRIRAAEKIMEKLEGKPLNKTDVTTNGESLKASVYILPDGSKIEM